MILLGISLVGTSYLMHSQVDKPNSTIDAAANYRTISAGICVTGNRGTRYEIVVRGGQLQSGSTGLVSSRLKLQQGDCLTSVIRLKPTEWYSKYSFEGRLLETDTQIWHSESNAWLNSIRANFSGVKTDSANLVAGLAIGIDQGLSKRFVLDMKTTGLTHLTAVSGANCAIIIGLVWLLLRRVRIMKPIKTVIALLSLFGYVQLVGNQPSVLRAAFMMAVVFVSLEFGRKIWLPRALLLGSFLLELIDPWMIFDYGFWLSVLATYGLIRLTPSLASYFEKYLPRSISLGLAATIAAQIWCLPLLTILQGGFTTYSIFANLLVEPIVPIITVLGVLAAASSIVAPTLFDALMQVAAFFANWIVFVAQSLASAPANQLPMPSDLIGIFIISLFVISLSAAIVQKRWGIAIYLAFLLPTVWAAGLLKMTVASLSWPQSNWVVVSCNVGQGDALVIRSQGKVALIDVGREDKPVDECLDRLNVKTIDLLVLTHFDADHAGGISGAIKGRQISLALISGFADERPLATFDKQLLKQYAIEQKTGVPNMGGVLGDFRWTIISAMGEAGEDSNQASLGISFVSKNLEIYTLADLDAEIQCSISNLYSTGLPTIVKVAHHGSADQCSLLYENLNPTIALISVGKGNGYGHPTKSALDMLSNLNVATFRTDELGSLSITQNPQSLALSVTGSG